MELYLNNYKGFVDTLIPIKNVIFLRNWQSVSQNFSLNCIWKMTQQKIREYCQKLLHKAKRLWSRSIFYASITLVGLFCVFIIRCAIYNNISYNEEKESKKSTELLKDSLFLRQLEMQDLLLRKTSLLDSMNLDHKSNNSIIKEEIQKIRDNSDEILKFQKKIYKNSKK